MQANYPTAPFIREPAEEYRSKRSHYLTSHQLIDFAACPLRYRQKQSGLIPDFRSDTYLIGAATHALTLEGQDAFDREYCVGGPINEKTGRPYGSETKAFTQWARDQGKAALSDEQYQLVCCLASAVRHHAYARELLSGPGIAEGVLRAKWQDVECQARLDWFSEYYGIVDLKTCDNLDEFATASPQCAVVEYHYREQMAFYRILYNECTYLDAPVYLIAVEKRQPYRVGVWQLTKQELDAAHCRNVVAVEHFKACRADNAWPTGYENLRTI